jgi:RecA/RadA recombinase
MVNVSSTDTSTSSLSSFTNETMLNQKQLKQQQQHQQQQYTQQQLLNNNNTNNCAICIRAIEIKQNTNTNNNTTTTTTTSLNSLESLTIRSSAILPIKCKNPEHNKNIINQTLVHTINSVAFKSTLRAKKVQS